MMSANHPIDNERPPTSLCTADFDFALPPELIAQTPPAQRDQSRLLVLDRESCELAHRVFGDIMSYLQPADMLVVNSSKVIPARLLGQSVKTGADIELLLLRAHGQDVWETLVRPGKRARVGATFLFSDNLRAEVVSVLQDGNRLVRLLYDQSKYRNVYEVLEETGNMPLPPYIKTRLQDKNRYQTVYAKEEGSAAAPTAGLHFTNELLAELRDRGVGYGEVTLHVGLGTFRPVKTTHIQSHHMHTEHFSLSRQTAEEINRRRAAGGRIVAVGTTTCRVLESVADADGTVHAMEGETAIFIYPGYTFRAVDALITNFHLPESSLIMLVSAFATRESILHAYQAAIEERYRFFSFGDAMLIL